MKDIIATLEAKRDAARAGQGRRGLAVLVAIALVGCGAGPGAASPSPAARMEASRWIAPGDIFSVVIPDGWIAADRAEHAEWFHEEFLLLAVPAETVRPESLCYVIRDDSTPMPFAMSRARMNEATRRLQGSQVFENMRANPSYHVDRVESAEIDGVATLDVYALFGSLDTVQRRFFLHHNGALSMYTLSCSPVRADQAAVNAARALAASLRFTSLP
jgi:hypothetical protein